jgi:hypothetical protein
MSHISTEDQLEAEKKQLTHLKNPVEKTKSYIRLSDLLLTLAAGAVHDADNQKLSSLLNEYATAIKAAHETMTASGRNPDRSAAAYTGLEISLRKQARRLGDIRVTLSSEERESVDKALEAAVSIRREVLRLLLGPTQQATH